MATKIKLQLVHGFSISEVATSTEEFPLNALFTCAPAKNIDIQFPVIIGTASFI
jgi:hypothetical protein